MGFLLKNRITHRLKTVHDLIFFSGLTAIYKLYNGKKGFAISCELLSYNKREKSTDENGSLADQRINKP